MAKIEIYTIPGCPYCIDAKALLDRKAHPYIEYPNSREPEQKAEMVRRANGRTTFPQIFIDDKHIGGCDDLMALDARGGLDPLLGINKPGQAAKLGNN